MLPKYPYGNHIGEQFGHLLAVSAIETDPSTGDPVVYDCKCMKCGKEHIRVLDKDLLSYKVRCCSNCDPSDLVGMKFSRWTVIRRVENDRHHGRRYQCKCSCDKGTVKIVHAGSLIRRMSMSCGCLHKEVAKMQGSIRGKANTKWTNEEAEILSHYTSMMTRCYNRNSNGFQFWGGRGIRVCDEWKDPINGRKAFVAWAKVNGFRNDLSLDRIDVNGPYAPWNCRWITLADQNRNKRTNIRIEVLGETRTIAEWSRLCGVARKRFYNLFKRKGVEYLRAVIMHLARKKKSQSL